jgi:hypothetical protein
MDVVIGAFGAQGRFELGGGHCCVSHFGSPGTTVEFFGVYSDAIASKLSSYKSVPCRS